MEETFPWQCLFWASGHHYHCQLPQEIVLVRLKRSRLQSCKRFSRGWSLWRRRNISEELPTLSHLPEHSRSITVSEAAGWTVKVPPKQAFCKLEAALRCCAATHATDESNIVRGDRRLCLFLGSCFRHFLLLSKAPKTLWFLGALIRFSKISPLFLRRYGWQVKSPWTWSPTSDDSVRSLQPSSRWFARNCKVLLHSLREVWKKAPYCEARRAAARSHAAQSCDSSGVAPNILGSHSAVVCLLGFWPA